MPDQLLVFAAPETDARIAVCVVPELARRYIAADGPDGKPTRDAIEVVFATLHRSLGVGIGEHLGYLLTGVWTFLVTAQIVSTNVLPGRAAVLMAALFNFIGAFTGITVALSYVNFGTQKANVAVAMLVLLGAGSIAVPLIVK